MLHLGFWDRGEVRKHRREPGDGVIGVEGRKARGFHCKCPVLDHVTHGTSMSIHRDPFLSNNKCKARHQMVR